MEAWRREQTFASKLGERSAGIGRELLERFKEAYTTLKRRIELFASLPFDKLGPAEIKSRMAEIGKQ